MIHMWRSFPFFGAFDRRGGFSITLRNRKINTFYDYFILYKDNTWIKPHNFQINLRRNSLSLSLSEGEREKRSEREREEKWSPEAAERERERERKARAGSKQQERPRRFTTHFPAFEKSRARLFVSSRFLFVWDGRATVLLHTKSVEEAFLALRSLRRRRSIFSLLFFLFFFFFFDSSFF